MYLHNNNNKRQMRLLILLYSKNMYIRILELLCGYDDEYDGVGDDAACNHHRMKPRIWLSVHTSLHAT